MIYRFCPGCGKKHEGDGYGRPHLCDPCYETKRKPYLDRCPGCGHPAPGHLPTCGAYRKLRPLSETKDAPVANNPHWQELPKPDHVAFKHGYKVGDRIKLGESVVYVTEVIDDFSFKHSTDPPDRIAELREKYPKDYSYHLELQEDPRSHALEKIVANLNEAHVDINELLDMLEKADAEHRHEMYIANGYQRELTDEIGQLKAELEGAKRTANILLNGRAETVRNLFDQVDNLKAARKREAAEGDKWYVKCKKLEAALEAKPDIQQDWIRCALIRKAEILKIPMSCHKANELARAIYDKIEEQRNA